MPKEMYMPCVFGYKMQSMCFVTTAIEADTVNVNKKRHVVIVMDQPSRADSSTAASSPVGRLLPARPSAP
jgi:hypothetical protein